MESSLETWTTEPTNSGFLIISITNILTSVIKISFGKSGIECVESTICNNLKASIGGLSQ